MTATIRIVLSDYWTRRRLQAAALASGISAEDAALDYIAPLFSREPDNYLATALAESLLKDDAGLLAEFKAVAIQFTRQELFHRWVETDSTAAKIWKNMWSALRHNRNLKLWPMEKPRWAVLKTQSDLRTECPPIPPDEALHLVIALSSAHRTFPSLIRAILAQLAADTRWQAAIRIEEILFESLCEAAKRGILSEESDHFAPSEPSKAFEIARGRAIEAGLQKAREIIDGYVKSGKLDESMASAFERAIEDLLRDFGETGVWQGDYYGYLRRYCSKLEEQEFRRRFKARFDHVALSAERAFLNALEDELRD